MSYPLTLGIFLLITINANAADQALDAKQVTLIMMHKNSAMTIWLNGLPFKKIDAPGPASSDTIGSLAMLAVNGENVLVMEAQPSGDAANSETTFQIIMNTGSMADFDRPIFEKKFSGAGKAEFKMTLKGVPHWTFQDAEPYKGDTQSLLDAVKAMHKVIAAHDVKAFSAYMRPEFDELKAAAAGENGPSWDDTMHEYEDGLKGRLDPLPAKLKVQSGYGGRVFAVTSETGASPIQIFDTPPAGYKGRIVGWELGRFWIHRNGAWVLVGE